jgi:hypothetical protein
VDIEATENELLEQEFEVMNSHCPLVIIEFHPSRLDRNLRHYLEKMQSNYILSDRRGDVFIFQRLEEEELKYTRLRYTLLTPLHSF